MVSRIQTNLGTGTIGYVDFVAQLVENQEKPKFLKNWTQGKIIESKNYYELNKSSG